ncbi:MAG TPA: iron-sulfur cluster assembly accessory protein [Acidimicrobiales bacterium]|nr:iron-sulfur cluster assembly accessory protein [Acidimicrobiales bacterium]
MSVTETETTTTTTTEIETETVVAPTDAPIMLTPEAAKKVAELRAQEEAPETLSLRVAVRPGGCSGFSYEMFFDTEIADDDVKHVFPAGEGKSEQVVVDPQSAQLLQGATLEFKDGLQGAGFSINNPNATRSCGCGQSFS